MNTRPSTGRGLAWAAACLTFTLASAQASPVAQQIALPQSSIKFVSRQMGVPVEGHFKRFQVISHFNPRQPAASSVVIEVDLGSVDIGNPDTEHELGKPGWFDSVRRPTATFKSQVIRGVAVDRFEVQGTLTIKGLSRQLVIPVHLAQKGGVTTARGAVPIRRMDFRIGDGEWNDVSIVANDVQVSFQLALTGVPALQ